MALFVVVVLPLFEILLPKAVNVVADELCGLVTMMVVRLSVLVVVVLVVVDDAANEEEVLLFRLDDEEVSGRVFTDDTDPPPPAPPPPLPKEDTVADVPVTWEENGSFLSRDD